VAKVSDAYGFLAGCTGQYDVILTDMGFSSLVVPTFGGKLVATGYSIPFVNDTATRQADVERFLAPDGTMADRRAILTRCGVYYPLVDQAEFDSLRTHEGSSGRLGDVPEHGGLVLIATRSTSTAQGKGNCER
jgi:hypothetical protein